VIVLVLVMLVIGLAAGTAAVTEALSARGHGNRDDRSSRALQAADAGVETELYRANQINLGALKLSSGLSLSSILTQLLTCPVPQITVSGGVTSIGLQFTAATSSSSHPCPANGSSGISSPLNSQEPIGQHSYFQSAFIPGATSVGDFIQFSPKIVASGVDDNGNTSAANRYVSRRVEAILAPVTPWRTLEAMNNLEIDVPPALGLVGVTAFNGTAAAGGNLTIKGSGLLGGSLTGTNVSGSSLLGPVAIDYCGSKTVTSILLSLFLGNITHVTPCNNLVSRSPVTISPSKSNCVPTGGVESCATDAGFGSQFVAGRTSAGVASAVLNNEDEIYDTTGTPISFGPGDYVFCSFQTNGIVNLNPTSTQAVRIFIDSPASNRCSGFVGHNGVSAGNFIATKGVGNVLAATHPSQAQIYVAGNGISSGGTPNTTVTMTASSGLTAGQGAFVYAPTSAVTVDSSLLGTGIGTLFGSYVGYNLTVSATAVSQDLGLLNYPLSSTLGPFYIKQYIECAPQYPLSATDPANGC
jgi:hypothetical protein